MTKASSFVTALAALRDSAASFSTAAETASLAPAEALVAKKLVRDLEQGLARLEAHQPAEADLISIACHDLKDPLASIVMGAGFLRKTIPAEDAAAKRVVEAIARSTDRMSQVIGDFHDLAKLESGRLTLDVRPCDIVAVLKGAVPALQARAAERGLELEVVIPDAPLLAVCDRARLGQVVTKLVANAVKFTNAPGKIVLRVEALHTALDKGGNGAAARISVIDTGRGIPAERLPTIFDYAANARRTPRDGPGLGLAIAQGLLILQKSTMAVESKVDGGSTFSFVLAAAA